MARIGTRFCGEICLSGGHSIQTKFFVLVVPLVPLESFYVMTETPGFFSSSVSGLPIPLNGPSVLLGYLELGVVIGLISLIAVFAGDGWVQRGLGVLGLVILFGVIMKAKAEGRRAEFHHTLLQEAVGSSADPEWLPQPAFGQACAVLIRKREEGCGEKSPFKDLSLAYAIRIFGAESMRREGNHEKWNELRQEANNILERLLARSK